MSTGLQTDQSSAERSDDRRRERRAEVDFTVRLQAPVRADGQAVELSPGGMRLEVGQDLTHAVQVSLEFDLPEAPGPIGVLADVRWHEKRGSKSDPHWVYGLRFDDLDQSEGDAIRGHIEALRARRQVAE